MYPQYGAPAYPQPFQQPRTIPFVKGYEGMLAYPVGPGEVVAVFDMDSPTMWLKSANQSGVQSNVEYQLTERSQQMAGDVESRLTAIEESIRQIQEALNANPVPDVRTAATPQHYAGDSAGA